MEEHEPQVRSGPEPRLWWTVFGDPVLDHLVRLAYEQNIPLRVAGARIYQARARLGIAIGEQYPQVQQAVGAADAAKRSADLALVQYREGATDYTTVIQAEQALLTQQDNLAIGQGNVPLNLVSVYRALGGGWELREGEPFLPADVTTAMAERTDWGRLLQPAALQPPEPKILLTPDW